MAWCAPTAVRRGACTPPMQLVPAGAVQSNARGNLHESILWNVRWTAGSLRLEAPTSTTPSVRNQTHAVT
eukprot:scaffold840_cov344-Pavlova_lutheri.AAC.21